MADGPGHDVPLRRRREGRTDYGKRLELLKSGEHRAVIRIANNHARVQLVAYGADGDRTTTAAFSKQLAEYGWDAHTGNLPAAYLTGFLAGTRALDAGIETAIADLGLYEQQDGSRAYAALKGLRDAGLDVNAGETVLPSDERVRGEHADAHESAGITDMVEETRADIEEAY